MAHRLGSHDTTCHLHGAEEESYTHVFFHCPISKAIWFGCQWSLRIDRLNISKIEDIIEFIVNPPIHMVGTSHDNKEAMSQCSIKLTLTLDAISDLRNQMAHMGAKVNLITTISGLEIRAREHIAALTHTCEFYNKDLCHWNCPPQSDEA